MVHKGDFSVRAAFATDDGHTFISRHFGDARYFDIYDIDGGSAVFVKRIENTIEEDESVHADPKKAGGITGLLMGEGVTVAVSRVFGPNIKRIKTKFVCILVNDSDISIATSRIQSSLDAVLSEFSKGADRNFLNFALQQLD